MRKPPKFLMLMGCVALAAAGGVLPFVGWLLLVLALHILVSEFETGRAWVRETRRRWPFLSRCIARARAYRRAPRRLQLFDELTDPSR